MEDHTLLKGKAVLVILGRRDWSARDVPALYHHALLISKPCLVIVTSLRRLRTRRARIPQAKGTFPGGCFATG